MRGPDQQEKKEKRGEKDLLVPPGHGGEIPEGYYPFYSKTWKSVMAMRIVSKSGSYEEAVSYAKKLKAYPLAEAGKPSSYRMSTSKANRLHCQCCGGKRTWTTGDNCMR
jgi:hypothetical protein